ncbi:uncharacterized protein [Halyomorpha halys]|uniref:uncharacterized protein isoform X2 n=1 Tax=Halyomorpha halys TaxID=286706 RepID=UPI0034D26BE3
MTDETMSTYPSPTSLTVESDNLDFVVDEQDLESYDTPSDDEQISKRNKKKSKEDTKDTCDEREKFHQCPHCDFKRFSSKNSLKKHIMADHTDIGKTYNGLSCCCEALSVLSL